MSLSEIMRVASVDPEAVARTKTPAALWQMLRTLEQRVASAEAEAGEARLEARLATEAAEAAEATARAEKRAAAAVEQRAAVAVQTAERGGAAKAETLVAAALCQQRRQDWAVAAKAKAERLQASAEPRGKGAEPRRPLAPLSHHNYPASRAPASPAATHRSRAATADRASPTDHNCGGTASGCNGRCGGLCTDGCGCGLWLRAPHPPTTASLPATGIGGCGAASNIEPQTAPLTGAHAKVMNQPRTTEATQATNKLRSVAQWLAPSPSAARRLEFEHGASTVRHRVGPSPLAAVVLLLLCLLCYGGCATRSAPASQPCSPAYQGPHTTMHNTSSSPSPSPSPFTLTLTLTPTLTLALTITLTPHPLCRSRQDASDVRSAGGGASGCAGDWWLCQRRRLRSAPPVATSHDQDRHSADRHRPDRDPSDHATALWAAHASAARGGAAHADSARAGAGWRGAAWGWAGWGGAARGDAARADPLHLMRRCVVPRGVMAAAQLY